MNNKLIGVISSLIVAGMLLLSLWTWRYLPDTQLIPVHYGLDGTPNRYGSKFEGLFLTPLIAAGLILLFAVIPQIDPRTQNLSRSEKAYAATWLTTIAFLASIHVATVMQALGWHVNVGSVVSVGVSVLLIIIGNYLGKVLSNFFFGIRTPWTLSSERSWNQTHRLGGRLMFLLGIGCILAAMFEANILFFVLVLGGMSGISILLVIYSYLLWKDDPEKHSIDR